MTTRLTYPLDDAVRAAVSKMHRSEANRFRDIRISAEEKKERDDTYEKIGLCKIVVTIVAIVSVVLFVSLPNFFTGVVTGLVLWSTFARLCNIFGLIFGESLPTAK